MARQGVFQSLGGQTLKVSSTFKMVYLALLSALAIGLHALEALLPVPFLFPGAKIGLANIVALYAVATFGLAEALSVSLLRTTLGSLIGGTFLSVGFFLSLSGAVASTFIMGLAVCLGRGRLGLVGVSLLGSVTHNITQLLVAVLIVRHAGLFLYLPYLLAFSLPTGIFVGLVTKRLKQASDPLMIRSRR